MIEFIQWFLTISAIGFAIYAFYRIEKTKEETATAFVVFAEATDHKVNVSNYMVDKAIDAIVERIEQLESDLAVIVKGK